MRLTTRRALEVLCRCMALAALLAANAAAAMPSHALDSFYETHWYAHDGAPANVTSIAQTTDGFLWLSSDRGLVRFDGVKFEPLSGLVGGGEALLSPVISLLKADPAGGLWIGYLYGGLSHLQGRHLVHYARSAGLPTSTSVSVLADSAGRFWVSTSNGVYLRHGEAFEKLPASRLASNHTYKLVEDGAGGVWSSNSDGVSYLAKGADRFVDIGLPLPHAEVATELAVDGAGRVWAIARNGGKGLAGPVPLPGEDVALNAARWRAVPPANDSVFRGDALWFVSNDGVDVLGVGALGAAGVAKGGSTQPSSAVFLDREGTVWVGASNGLLSYRPTKLQHVSMPSTADLQIASVAHQQALLATTGDGAISRVVAGDAAAGGKPARAKGKVDAMFVGPDQSVWMVGAWGLERRLGGQVSTIELPTWPGTVYEGITALATDDANEPWVSLPDVGVFQHTGGHWRRYGADVQLPHELVFRMGADAARRLWFTYPDGRVFMLDHAASKQLTPIEGLRTGGAPVLGFGDSGNVWIVGNAGIALVDQGGVHDLGGPVPAGQPVGALETSDGDLWIHTLSAVLHVPRIELARAVAEHGYEPVTEHLDYLDGLSPDADPSDKQPSMVRTSDGRLWFARQDSLLTIMPGHVASNALPPPVSIEWISADGQRLPLHAGVALPSGTREVKIGFTGLSLAIPQRVLFRSLLQGQDERWSAPSPAREVTYTNLAPGRFMFRVTAANEDGVWNADGATLDFRVLPRFWQTAWFEALCALLLVGLAWTVHGWRVRKAATRARDRVEARVAERSRIARNLHDTLLQSTLALSMKFQSVADRFAAGDPMRERLDEALEIAARVMAEGRESIDELRREPAHDELATALLAATLQLVPAEGRPVARADVLGAPRTIDDEIWRECFRIGGEALANAYQHAKASEVLIRTTYASGRFCLEVRDNGCGFDVARRPAGGPGGHWGLLGMRERAGRLALALTIVSAPGAGTTVRVNAPGYRAYVGTAGFRARFIRLVRGIRTARDELLPR